MEVLTPGKILIMRLLRALRLLCCNGVLHGMPLTSVCQGTCEATHLQRNVVAQDGLQIIQLFHLCLNKC